MKVTDTVHLVDGISYSNVFLVADKSLILIDTGMPNNAEKIFEYISKSGLSRENLKSIVITHYHPDHIGSLFDVWSKTRATVYVHENDADYVTGNKQLPYPKGATGLFYRLLSIFTKLKFVKDVKTVKDGDVVDGLKVVHTPGHTSGHICLYNPKEKTLFSSDMFEIKNGELKPMSMAFVEDELELKASMERISKIDFENVCPGHGEFMKVRDKADFKRLLKEAF